MKHHGGAFVPVGIDINNRAHCLGTIAAIGLVNKHGCPIRAVDLDTVDDRQSSTRRTRVQQLKGQ